MNKSKRLSKLLAASIFLGSLTFVPNVYNLPITSIAYAEVKTYTGTSTAMFDFGEDDEQIVAMVKNFAKERAMQAAKEKAGVYLSSYSKTNNLRLVENEVKVITNNK